LFLSACVHEVEQHGYSFEQNNMHSIKVGSSTVYDVMRDLGTPTSQSDYGDKIFYYISYKSEKVAFFDPKVIEQRVLAITFNNKGLVKDIAEHTIDDYKNIAFSKHKTELKGSTLTPMEQIMSNIGKHNKKQKQF
jgi:outer membrane protein assembly factor BamE (lipoprotein component of BamABCDE complex)